MKNSQEGSARADDFQSRISYKPEWFAVPVAAKRFGESIRVAILPAANPLTIASAMLQQQNFAGHTTDPRHFLERSGRIGKRAGRERRNDRCKTVISKRKVFRVRDQKRNMHGKFCGSVSRDFQYVRAEIEGDDPAIRSIIRQVFSGSGGDFEHFSGRAPEQLPP